MPLAALSIPYAAVFAVISYTRTPPSKNGTTGRLPWDGGARVQ